MLFELKLGANAGERLSGQLCDALTLRVAFRHGFAIELDQAWFVIEEVELRRSAGLEQIDDSFGSRGEVKRPQNSVAAWVCIVGSAGGFVACPKELGIEERGECDGPQSARGATEELSSRHLLKEFRREVHDVKAS